jgi:hypothetical protein
MAFADLVATVDRAVRDRLGGVAVVYAPKVGSPPIAAVTVQGIYDEQTLLVDEGEAGAEMLGPAVFLRLEELPTDPEDDDPAITVSGKTYRVRDRRRDGLGGIRLTLQQGS